MAHTAIGEIAGVLARTGPDEAEHMCAEIRNARRIACHGVGREGLIVKALCMRLPAAHQPGVMQRDFY